MRKGIWILIICAVYVLSGCSGNRRLTTSNSIKPSALPGLIRYGDLTDKNISNQGVFVRRIRFEASIEGNRNRFTANLRKSANDEWLVSVRSLLGIEVARIFADANGVTLLDRLAGSADIYDWERLSREFGLSYDMLPLLLGDIPWKKELERNVVECDDPIRIAGRTGPTWMITVDCESGRPREVVVSDPVHGRQVTFIVLQFLIKYDRFLPYEIAVTEGGGVLQVRYTMEDIEINWDGTINFSIPSNYKINR